MTRLGEERLDKYNKPVKLPALSVRETLTLHKMNMGTWRHMKAHHSSYRLVITYVVIHVPRYYFNFWLNWPEGSHELLSSLCPLSSVNFSYFYLLLQKHLPYKNQTWQGYSVGGILQSLSYLMIRNSTFCHDH
jgi:hypothetical protein